ARWSPFQGSQSRGTTLPHWRVRPPALGALTSLWTCPPRGARQRLRPGTSVTKDAFTTLLQTCRNLASSHELLRSPTGELTWLHVPPARKPLRHAAKMPSHC